jgi:hypothetical protein
MEGRDRAKVEDAGSSPAGISRCRSRPIAGRERAKLETWVRFPAFAPVFSQHQIQRLGS